MPRMPRRRLRYVPSVRTATSATGPLLGHEGGRPRGTAARHDVVRPTLSVRLLKDLIPLVCGVLERLGGRLLAEDRLSELCVERVVDLRPLRVRQVLGDG